MILSGEFVEFGYVDTAFQCLMCREKNNDQMDESSYYPKGFIIQSRGLQENGAGEYEYNPRYDHTQYRFQEIWWLTKRTELTRERSEFLVYGNEAEIAHTYGDVVLIASVGGHGNRQIRSEEKEKGCGWDELKPPGVTVAPGLEHGVSEDVIPTPEIVGLLDE